MHKWLRPANRELMHHDLFDENFYESTYPDVRNFVGGSWAHFSRHGWKESRIANPDLVKAKLLIETFRGDDEKVSQDLDSGAQERASLGGGRVVPSLQELDVLRSSGWFSPSHYQTQLEKPLGDEDALRHYLLVGEILGLNPHPMVDPVYYRRQLGDKIQKNDSELLHFVKNLRNPEANPGGIRVERFKFSDHQVVNCVDRLLRAGNKTLKRQDVTVVLYSSPNVEMSAIVLKTLLSFWKEIVGDVRCVLRSEANSAEFFISRDTSDVWNTAQFIDCISIKGIAAELKRSGVQQNVILCDLRFIPESLSDLDDIVEAANVRPESVCTPMLRMIDSRAYSSFIRINRVGLVERVNQFGQFDHWLFSGCRFGEFNPEVLVGTSQKMLDCIENSRECEFDIAHQVTELLSSVDTHETFVWPVSFILVGDLSTEVMSENDVGLALRKSIEIKRRLRQVDELTNPLFGSKRQVIALVLPADCADFSDPSFVSFLRLLMRKALILAIPADGEFTLQTIVDFRRRGFIVSNRLGIRGFNELPELGYLRPSLILMDERVELSHNYEEWRNLLTFRWRGVPSIQLINPEKFDSCGWSWPKGSQNRWARVLDQAPILVIGDKASSAHHRVLIGSQLSSELRQILWGYCRMEM